MRYEVIDAKELSDDMILRWAEIQESNSDLVSPYFRPEFTIALSAVRQDVRVALFHDGVKLVGFFPFHHSRGGIARPIGLGLSDYHGIVAGPDAEWTADEFMRKCNFHRFEFDHLLASQKQFTDWHDHVTISPIIDISAGFDRFEASLGKSGRKQFKEAQRKQKKLEAHVGPLKFTVHSKDESILNQLFKWKSLQCRQTGTVDYFSKKWCSELIRRIHSKQDSQFGGVLSCLHAGDQLAAVHFVMHSQNVWHSWFPAYNDNLNQYSPGLILLYEMIRFAAGKQVNHIDLGKGLSLYKKRVMTGGIPIAEGCIELPSIRNWIRHCRTSVEEWSKQSALKPVLRIPGRIINAMERKKRYE